MKKYIQLIKPGYIIGTGLTAVAGFIFASRGQIHLVQFLGTIIGICTGIAAACVFNNYIDRGIDAKMERTKKRALVTGSISTRNALILGVILGLLGVGFLAYFTNLVTLSVGALGLFFYEILYARFKRTSSWSTVIGSVAGAIPPLAGYTAVVGKLDTGAVLLFLIFVFWQMPHFYAIATYRREEYKAAGLPVLPVAKGVLTTKVHILLYLIGFSLATLLLSITGYAGKIFFFTMLVLCVLWISYGCVGFFTKNANLWARRMFFISLVVNLVLSLLLICNFFLF